MTQQAIRPITVALMIGTISCGAGTTSSLGAQQLISGSPSLAFEGVTVVDVVQGKLMPDQTVIVTENRIQTVARRQSVDVPAGTWIINAQGKYLIPGLWDMHAHATGSNPHLTYPLLLANGVTGIREPGSSVPLDTLLLWQREILAGSRVGPPRQILSGPSINGKPSCVRASIPETSHQTCVTKGDTADIRYLVDSLKAAGADMIKPYNVDAETYFLLAAAARQAGIPFGGHSPSATARSAPAIIDRLTGVADSGASIIDHPFVSGIDGVCWNQPSATIDACQQIAERFRQRNTWWVPTLTRMRIEQPDGTIPEWSRSASLSARLADFGRQFWEDSAAAIRPLRLSDSTQSSADSLGALQLAQRVGLPILAGTDGTGKFQALSGLGLITHMLNQNSPLSRAMTRPMLQIPMGFALHAELAILAAEGLSPLRALQAATLNPAKMLQGTDSLGTVAPGKLADLVLLDANPLEDIANTTMIRAVVANGRYFDRAALDQLLVSVSTSEQP